MDPPRESPSWLVLPRLNGRSQRPVHAAKPIERTGATLSHTTEAAACLPAARAESHPSGPHAPYPAGGTGESRSPGNRGPRNQPSVLQSMTAPADRAESFRPGSQEKGNATQVTSMTHERMQANGTCHTHATRPTMPQGSGRLR